MKRRQTLLRACLYSTLIAGCREPPAPHVPEAPEVSVSQPLEKPVTDYVELTGRTDAVYLVDVRAKVNGYLKKVAFKDGQMVKKREILYEIDPRPYQADLDKAKGEVEKLLGAKKLYDIQVDRYTRLVAKGAASQQDLDTYVGKQAETVGAIAAARAQVEYAKLNLDFCTIRSEIDGQVGRTFFQIGNLIAPDRTTLTTVVSVDPIYAYFNVDENTLLRVQQLVQQGKVQTLKEAEIPVEMGLADDVDRKFPLHGLLDFINPSVDKLTGTITVRGVFKHPYGLAKDAAFVKPGMFIRVRVPLGKSRERLLVNERAIGTDQGHKFLYLVNDQNKVKYRRVRLGRSEKGLQVIEEGLAKNDWVVVNGLQRCRPNQEVKPLRVDMITLQGVGKKASE